MVEIPNLAAPLLPFLLDSRGGAGFASVGDRKEARVKMVLPIRVWGVDGSGQLFNQLAHTLDISRTGARLGGMRGMLAAGDSLTVQYKQKKAQFKVVWVGRPGSVGERQVGLASLEPDKYIWIDIPREEYRDEFDPAKSPRKKPPAPLPSPPPSPAAAPAPAAPAPSAEKHEAAIAEPPALAPAVPPSPPPAHPPTAAPSAAAPAPAAPADSAAVLTQRLKKLTAELIDLQDALKTDEVDPVALQDFRSIVNIIRHYGWVLQQWIEQQKGAEQAFPLAVMLLRERIRLAVQLLQSMSADVAQGIDFEADQMHSLQAAARELFSQKRLAPASAPETAAELPPLPVPAPAGPIKELEQELQACDKHLGKGLNLIAERMRLWTGADGAAIALRDGDVIVCQGSVGLAPDVGVPLPEDSPLIGDSLRTGLPASCGDTENDSRVDAEICRSIGLRSTAIVPILHERAACGILQVFSSTAELFQPRHIRLLQQVAEVVNEFCLLARS